MFSRRLIWPADTPMTAGPMSTRIRRTPGIAEREARPRQHADPRKRRDLERELEHAAREHRPRKDEHRRIEMPREQERTDDERDVEERRGEGRDREPAPGVEDPGGERDERDEQDVRKGDPQHRHRQAELLGARGEPGRGDVDDQRGRGDAERRRDHEREEEGRRHAVHQVPGLVLAVSRLVLGEDRHERLREGSFREQAPQQVRDPEGDEEGVGGQPSAEDRGDHRIADEAEDARDQRHPAHRRQGADEVHPGASGRTVIGRGDYTGAPP